MASAMIKTKSIVTPSSSRLTVLGPSFRVRVRPKRVEWLVVAECQCGDLSIYYSDNVVSGKTKSCGCYRNQRTAEESITHGLSKTPLYKVWRTMRARCNNPKNASWPNYGGRGIRVCQSWDNPNNGFLAFLADMGNPPSPGMTVERIDTNGDYTPANCKWATRQEQAENRRNVIRITYKGETRTLSHWSRVTGIPLQVLYGRYSKLKWNPDRMLTTPVANKKAYSE